MREVVTYGQAIHQALIEEMHRDSRVFVYGIDVGDHKGIFGTTRGLAQEFGTDRCFSTPLSEDAMTGFGLGAAMNGLRPVHVHMRVDFMILAMNQIANMIASCHYASCGKLRAPMVIRAVIGRGWGQAWQHSKSLHSWFAHVPGLKVVMPSRARDAKGMLKAAIRDENPVIFIEHRWMYDVPGTVEEGPCSLEGAKVLRPGRDITLGAVSWRVIEAMKAARVLEKHGVDAEVVDLRSIAPFDAQTLAASVQGTGHLVVADYDWLHCGFSAEVAARIHDLCFDQLKGPVERIGFAPTHCPTTRPLEDAYYPNAVDIIRAVERQLDLAPLDLSREEFYSYEDKFKGPF